MLIVVVVAVVWIPIRRSRLGLALYAIGSNPLAAFRSGVSVVGPRSSPTCWVACSAAMAGLA